LAHLDASFPFSIAKSALREAEKDYHFGVSGSFSNYQGHTATLGF
jgi:Tfp pilus assembly protein PilX